MSLIIIFVLFLFIYSLIYFDRKLLELIIHFSFACDLYFLISFKIAYFGFLILSYMFFFYYYSNPWFSFIGIFIFLFLCFYYLFCMGFYVLHMGKEREHAWERKGTPF